MSLRCFFGWHRPSLASIMRKKDRYIALCERCGCPLVRYEAGRWTASESLVGKRPLSQPPDGP